MEAWQGMFANTTGCGQTVLMSLAPNLVTGAAHAYVANPQQPEDEASEEPVEEQPYEAEQAEEEEEEEDA